jgi:hypothetical protein
LGIAHPDSCQPSAAFKHRREGGCTEGAEKKVKGDR